MSGPDSTRKLWVLKGEATQLLNQLSDTINQHQADWITITTQNNLPPFLTKTFLPNQTKSLLGREFLHAIFDATQGFNLDAFAMLVGTLVKGSILILLLPEDFNHWLDQDSIRWNENSQAIEVPNFVKHLEQILKDFDIESDQFDFPNIQTAPLSLTEQQTILERLLISDAPIKVLMAKRGRGKSALAGLFSHYHQSMIITAPNKSALTTFFRFAKSSVKFVAPDELIEVGFGSAVDYLIIDEAAMIPLPMLENLLQFASENNCPVLLTTTMEGYEGTGQGFLLQLFKNKSCEFFYLTNPIRWQAGDQLEAITDCLLLNGLFCQKQDRHLLNQSIEYNMVSRNNITALKQIFYLLKTAHYQTTLIDLRRIFDANNQTVWQAKQENYLIAGAITIDEGQLSDSLIEAVWQGTRRPKGNLVAQSLVAHAGEKLAAKLASVRINRIAVTESHRRQHIAQQLVERIYQHGTIQGKDFISVSYAFNQANDQFWSACGFVLVHVGSRKETSSGSYSVMALKPITKQGLSLTMQLNKKLQRNWYWLKNIIDLPLADRFQLNSDQQLTHQDLDELRGFCYYHRPYEATYAALCRLNQFSHHQQNAFNLPILKSLLQDDNKLTHVIKQYQLTGKAALMQAIKYEVKQWLNSVDNKA